jgi:hypothetical protein
MSPGDVHGDEMNEPTDVDEAAADALLAGSGQELDPALAAAVLAIRGLGTSAPPPPSDDLMQLMGTAPKRPNAPRRTRRWQAKIGAAAAVVIGATGGLATAHALPAPMQDAISRLGIGRPAHSHPSGSNAPTPNRAAGPAALGPSSTEKGIGSAVVGAPTTTAPGSRPATRPGAVPSTAAGSAPNSCAARAKHGAVLSGVSATQTCSPPVPAPTPLTAPKTTTSTSTPTTSTIASPNGGSNAGGNGKSNAGGNGKSNAGGNGKSNAGGNGKSNAGGNGKTKTVP